ncbi:MAG: Galactosyltransferase [uncultured bacterium]|nr:MAG: Galactosyltransferase [uncultured bacterium]HBR71289.1 hypothetical protein [Candidatus Moranbacteria bacterium]
MKNILLVTRPIAPPWDEASKNFAFTLAKNLSSSENLELHLMTNGYVSELPKSVVQEKIYTRSQNDFGFSQKIRSLLFQLKTRCKFNIAHYFFTPTTLNSFVIKNFVKNKKTKTIQTIATLREDLFSDNEIKKLIFGNQIITYSDYAKNRLEKMGFKNVQRIYPGIDLLNYKPRPKNENILKKFGFAITDFLIHFSGEYIRLGAMDDVIESFMQVSQKISSAKLLLAVRVKNEKDAEKKKQVVKKLQENNLLDKVAFFDDGKYEMSYIYNLADVSLFPVKNMYGKFDVPLVVIEAMACEKPVIISDIPILKEFSNEKNSLQIKAGNIDQLVQSILDLYGSKEKRTHLGAYARTYVEQNFDIENVAKQYEKIYNNI